LDRRKPTRTEKAIFGIFFLIDLILSLALNLDWKSVILVTAGIWVAVVSYGLTKWDKATLGWAGVYGVCLALAGVVIALT
jgi:hypothetical protein